MSDLRNNSVTSIFCALKYKFKEFVCELVLRKPITMLHYSLSMYLGFIYNECRYSFPFWWIDTFGIELLYPVPDWNISSIGKWFYSSRSTSKAQAKKVQVQGISDNIRFGPFSFKHTSYCIIELSYRHYLLLNLTGPITNIMIFR
jgi:hypothetical protein